MNYDVNVPIPDIAYKIAEIAETLRVNALGVAQSFWIPNFPLEHLPALNSALVAGYNVGVYTKADALCGGEGVRIYPLTTLKAAGVNPSFGSIETFIINLLGFKPRPTWHNGSVVWEGGSEGYPITLLDALIYGHPLGEPYRTDDTPTSKRDKVARSNVPTWTGRGGGKWIMHGNTVEECADADAQIKRRDELKAQGITAMFVPLEVWLAYNIAQGGVVAPTPEKPPESASTGQESVSDEDLDDL